MSNLLKNLPFVDVQNGNEAVDVVHDEVIEREKLKNLDKQKMSKQVIQQKMKKRVRKEMQQIVRKEMK